MPDKADARARASTWVFAALNTVEPPIVELETAQYFEQSKSWRDEQKAMIEKGGCNRLDALSAHLGQYECLDADFSAADVLMVSVLRRLNGSGIVGE